MGIEICVIIYPVKDNLCTHRATTCLGHNKTFQLVWITVQGVIFWIHEEVCTAWGHCFFHSEDWSAQIFPPGGTGHCLLGCYSFLFLRSWATRFVMVCCSRLFFISLYRILGSTIIKISTCYFYDALTTFFSFETH